MVDSNSTVQEVDAIIQAILYDVGVNAAVIYIVAQVPFLGLPLMRQITNWVVTQVAGILYKQLDQFVAFAIIDFQTQQEANAYLKSVNDLEAATESGDPNAIEKAKTDFKSNLAQLIHLSIV